MGTRGRNRKSEWKREKRKRERETVCVCEREKMRNEELTRDNEKRGEIKSMDIHSGLVLRLCT